MHFIFYSGYFILQLLSDNEKKTFKYLLVISTDIMQVLVKKRKKGVLRSPRLDTVLMVEKFIQEHDGEFKKKELWSNLPKKMMYQTFCVIIDYFLYHNRISIDNEGKIGWIYYPKKVDDRIKNKHLFWSSD